MRLDVAAVAALRARLWDAGFRPVAVLNWDHPVADEAGKRPLGADWHSRALQDPPDAIRFAPAPHVLNVGILCDGLRVVDADIDDQAIAAAVRSLAIERLGEAPIRWRHNSPRFLIPYRAAEGEPAKRTLAGERGKIEVLGRGQQFVAYGRHKTGAELQWLPEGLTDYTRDSLPAVTEEQLFGFLAAVSPLIEAGPPSRESAHDCAASTELTADLLDIASALACMRNNGPPDWEAWNRIGMATWAASGGSAEGFAAWAAWSAKNAAHDIAACRERWQHFPKSPPTDIGAGTLFHLARGARADWRKPSEQGRQQKAGAQHAPSLLRIVNPADLDGLPVPERLWIVADWLPIGCVTGQYGDGGAGKSMSALQLQVACATGTPWLGLSVMRCPTLGFYSEDGEDELHRRLERICRAFKLRYRDLDGMRWISGVGQDNALCTFDAAGRMHKTDRYYQIEEAAKGHGAKLLVLDNGADIFAGNENDRGQVRRFVGGLLTGLGIECGAGVLLNCHPSRAGLASGNLDGASTAWNNSMRSRWTLASEKEDAGDGAPDNGERLLKRPKANYAPTGNTIRLRWAGGVLVPVTRDGGIAGVASRAACEEVFLELLDRCEAQGAFVSESPNAGNYAPKVFARRPDREGYHAKDFERAMHRLLANTQIRMVEYRRTNRATSRRLTREQPGQKEAA